MISNFPDYFKTVRFFSDDCQFSGLFQNCLDFPDDCQKLLKEIAQKTGIFCPKKPFHIFQPFLIHFMTFFCTFLNLFNAQTLFLALLGEIKGVGGGWRGEVNTLKAL